MFIYITLGLLFKPFIEIALGRIMRNIVNAKVGVGLFLSLAYHNFKK
jgi:hypothetical protein